jgi:hypothetical protein
MMTNASYEIDDRNHYKTCAFSKEEYTQMIEKIHQIFKDKGIDKEISLWFSPNKDKDDEISWNEAKIIAYNKEVGDCLTYQKE